MKNLGLFGVAFGGLLVLISTYYLIKRFNTKYKLIDKMKVKLEEKLFYAAFLRYMIVSNLKLTYTIWAFLIGMWGFVTLQSSLSSLAYVIVLFAICLWPIFVIYILLVNHDKLQDSTTKRKFGILY